MGYFSNAGRKAIQAIFERLADEKVEVRRVAVLSLGRIGTGSHQVVEALKALAEDSDPPLRVNVVLALANLGKTDASALPAMIEALGSRDDTTGGMAVMVLGNRVNEFPDDIIPPLIEAVKKNQHPLARRALMVLRNAKNHADQVVPVLKDAYHNADSKTRLLVLRSLVEIDKTGDHAVPVCIEALKEDDPTLRREGLMGALRYKSHLEIYLDAIHESLRDPDEENRTLAIGIVRGLETKAVVCLPNLIALTKDRSQKLKLGAISALGAIGDTRSEVLGALKTALEDQDEKVRMGCVNALRSMGQRDPERVVPMLMAALEKEKNPRTKRAITATLDALSKKSSGAAER